MQLQVQEDVIYEVFDGLKHFKKIHDQHDLQMMRDTNFMAESIHISSGFRT
jgi:hypothetical protein